jgi:protein-S-isoprenylcysteine O-methyltransferase Ste14
MKTKSVIFYVLNQILGIVGMAVALFWSGGHIDWWPAWAAIVLWLACFTMEDIAILRSNPDLLVERLSPPKGAKAWDKAVTSILRLMELARYIIAGLDHRYGLTSGFPLAVQIAGSMVCVLSYALFVWAMASNSYFSGIVRIQTDRGHAVATNGPYRYVRHPGYVGVILFEFGISALLASWWALVAGGLCAVLLIIRTALEDRTLQTELTGYVDYARQVRYRLLPGIW